MTNSNNNSNQLNLHSTEAKRKRSKLTGDIAACVILIVLAIGSAILALILSAALAKLLVWTFGIQTTLGGAALVSVLALAGLFAWLWKHR